VDIVWSGYTPGEDYRVQVAFGDGRIQSLGAADVGDVPGPDGVNGFGADLVVGDLNRDGFADIVVGDPLATVDGKTVTSLWALWGAADGISATRATLLGTAPALSTGLTFVPLPEPVLALGTDEHRSGSVRLYPVAADGSLGRHRLITLATPGISGRIDPVAGSNFGQALAASGRLLVISDPNQFVGGIDAGAVWVLNMLPGLTFRAAKATQNGSGMPDIGEEGDDYGESVSVLGDRVVVGVPGESWRGHESAGAVAAFRVRLVGGTPRLSDAVQVTQDSPGVPGVAQASAAFGWRVQATLLCQGVPGALVFTDFDSGHVEDASFGTVSSVPFRDAGSCKAQRLATWVSGVRQPLTVVRTRPEGTSGELPAVGQREEHQLGFGWPGSQRVVDVGGPDKVGIDLLAAPAA
jgi:hypothetical protein